MPVDRQLQERFNSLRSTNDRVGGPAGLAPGGGDGHPPSMEAEIAVLKQRADQADQRMGRVEDKLDRIADRLGGLASKDDVKRAENAAWNALGVGGGVAVAIIALFVGVLAYLQDQRIAAKPEAPQAAAPAPIIIQLPPWPTPPAPAPAPPG